jgi:hypothetical protein
MAVKSLAADSLSSSDTYDDDLCDLVCFICMVIAGLVGIFVGAISGWKIERFFAVIWEWIRYPLALYALGMIILSIARKSKYLLGPVFLGFFGGFCLCYAIFYLLGLTAKHLLNIV